MTFNDINLRDPYIFPHGDVYYLFGTAGHVFPVYKSPDLTEWERIDDAFSYDMDPRFSLNDEYWAPEVHEYRGRYYLFATFHPEGQRRGTFILASDRPEGPYRVHSRRITPEDWECLDGTFYVEDGVPYMVFCHEWVQTKNGTICCVPLTSDLTAPAGPVTVLFDAESAPWTGFVFSEGNYVTDGPFLYRRDGELYLFWASFGDQGFYGGYREGIARSESGTLKGPWCHEKRLLFDDDGGHGMVFKTKDGREYFTCHRPNRPAGAERPVLRDFEL